MEEIQPTSWYGKYSIFTRFLAPSQVVVWDFFYQHYQLFPGIKLESFFSHGKQFLFNPMFFSAYWIK